MQDKIHHLAPLIASLRDEIESTRQLPPPLVDALRNAGMFRLLAPAKFGGCNADPATFVRVIEQLAAADASVGWVVSVGSIGGLFPAFMAEESAAAFHRENPDFQVAGSLNPTGSAITVDGGYRVTGRWTYGSGIQHAPWVYANCKLDGTDHSRLMLFPTATCTIHDTWHVAGLRGTGSHDFSVDDLFVPAHLSLKPFNGEPQTYPFSFLAVLIAAVPLGIARGAINAFVELARSKRQTELPFAQIAVARAETLLRAGRAFLFDAIHNLDNQLESRAILRLACTHAAQNAVQAVDLMFEAGGISSLFHSNLLERYFRDVRAAAQHVIVTPASFEPCGRVFLGLDAGPGRF